MDKMGNGADMSEEKNTPPGEKRPEKASSTNSNLGNNGVGDGIVVGSIKTESKKSRLIVGVCTAIFVGLIAWYFIDMIMSASGNSTMSSGAMIVGLLFIAVPVGLIALVVSGVIKRNGPKK